MSPQMSKITFELWGASGGDVNDVVYNGKTIKSRGGKGGYIKGEITREALQEFMEKFETNYDEARLLIFVGGKGFSQSDGVSSGGFNVGGEPYENNAGGGGASSIRMVNYRTYSRAPQYICAQDEKVLIVAGGGGGASIPSEEVMERGFGEDGADGCGYLDSETYLYNFSYKQYAPWNCTKSEDVWSQDYMITPGRNVDIQKCESNSICGLGGYNKRDGLFNDYANSGGNGLKCQLDNINGARLNSPLKIGCQLPLAYDNVAYGVGGGLFAGCPSVIKEENITIFSFCRTIWELRDVYDFPKPTAGGGGGGAGGYASPYITNVSGNCGSHTGNGRVRICYTIDEPTISKTFTYRKSKYGEIAFSEQICPYKVSDPIEGSDYYSLSNHKDNEGKVISNKMAIRCGKNGKWETEEVNGTEQLKYIYKCELLNKCPNPNKEEDKNKVWDSVIPIVNTGVTTNLEDGTKMQCIVDEEGNANYYKLHWEKL